jgi:hypothetical protein
MIYRGHHGLKGIHCPFWRMPFCSASVMLAMKPTGDEFQGKLSLARAALMDITIKRYRQAQLLGIKVELEILATPGCKVAEAQSGKPYSLDSLPVLPILGCDGRYGCSCRYSPVT